MTTWQESEIEELAQILGDAFETQHTFRKDVDPEAMINGWRRVLEGEAEFRHVITALDIHLKKSEQFPTPSHIYEILKNNGKLQNDGYKGM